ncbi:hypothetical protein D9M70_621460 [compost metagenome]
MTDRTDRLAGLEEATREGQRLVVDAERVGIEQAAGNDQRVVVLGRNFGQHMVDFDLVALVEVLESLDAATVE